MQATASVAVKAARYDTGMKLKLLTADGTAEIASWLESPERDVARGVEGKKAGRRQGGRLRTGTTAETQVGSPGTSLLRLRAEMRRDANQELWIAAVLWAASWGAVALLCV